MSDDLDGVAYVTIRGDGVSPEGAHPVAERSERNARVTELEGLIAHLESALTGLRALAEWIGQADQAQLPFSADQAARRAAEARAEHAEFRLQRSVDTNIGRQRQIQKLRARVNELEQALEACLAGERN